MVLPEERRKSSHRTEERPKSSHRPEERRKSGGGRFARLGSSFQNIAAGRSVAINVTSTSEELLLVSRKFLFRKHLQNYHVAARGL